jgi:hypothetical protein
LIGPTLEAIAGLRQYRDLSNVRPAAEALRGEFVYFVDLLSEITTYLGHLGLQVAAEISTQGQEIIGLIQPTLDSISALAGYQPPAGSIASAAEAVRAGFVLIVRTLEQINVHLGHLGLQLAAEISDSGQSIIGLIGPTIGAMADLNSWTGRGFTVNDLYIQAPRIRDAFVLLVRALADISTYLAGYGLQAAADISGQGQAIISLIAPTIEALADVSEWGRAGLNVETLYIVAPRIANAFAVLVDGLNEAVRMLAGRGLQVAADISGQGQAIIGLIAPTIEALADVSRWGRAGLNVETLYVVAPRIGNAFAVLVNGLNEAVKVLAGQGLEIAAEISDSGQSIISLIGATIETLADLSSWSGAGLNVETLYIVAPRLANAFAVLVSGLDAVLDELEGRGLAVSAEISDSGQSIIGLIQPTIEAIAALGDYSRETGLEDKTDSLAGDFVTIVSKLANAADHLKKKGVEVAAKVLEHAQAIVSVITPAVDGLTELGGYSKAERLTEKWEDFRRDFLEVVSKLSSLRNDIEIDAVAAASATLTATGVLFDKAIAAVDRIKAIAEYTRQQNLLETMTGYKEDLLIIVDTLREAATAIGTEGIQQALDFASAVNEIQVLITEALGTIGEEVNPESIVAAIEALQQALQREIGPAAHWAFLYGQAIAQGIVDGFNSIPMPTPPPIVPVPPDDNDGGPLPPPVVPPRPPDDIPYDPPSPYPMSPAPVSGGGKPPVNVNFGDVNIYNDMDAEELRSRIFTAVQDATTA